MRNRFAAKAAKHAMKTRHTTRTQANNKLAKEGPEEVWKHFNTNNYREMISLAFVAHGKTLLGSFQRSGWEWRHLVLRVFDS